ncbi:cytochrome P450 [Streptomyces tateyamensis]|uniref:Cytochrome P450 n=1 Tax=Streptomyces tateyamensis TaxID=565073 RepID=A0A2V4NVM9_9ACTN|nr:cytochrome P450 [Streptomyces tateyamensis]PYC71666.1 cytochrome P450 [Streptomyces tateyamensis]
MERGPVTEWTVDDLDELAYDPVMADALTRERLGLVRLPHGEGEAWLAGKYADVTRVTSDARFSRAALLRQNVTRLAPNPVPLHDAVGFADPPEHARLRRSASQAFTHRRIEQLRPRWRELASDLVAAMVRDGAPADLVARVYAPFAMHGMSELMGIPEPDREQLVAWAGQIISGANPPEVSERAKHEVSAYFDRLADQRLAEPQDDLISHLLEGERAGELTRDQLVGFAVLMQLSGMMAVRCNSSTMAYTLLTRPELWQRLVAEPALVPQAVEELLRWVPHRNAVGQARIATEDVELGGVLVRAGEAVHSSYVAANRDPEVFERPHELDFDRAPNPHLAFGHGPHYCVGAAFARMETQVLLATLLDRLPQLRLAVPPEQVPWRRGELIRGPRELPVAW